MPRRSREETTRLLLDEGSRLLLTEGFRGLSSIRLIDVCESLERRTGIRITPGSVYERIWRDQRAFQLAVTAEVLSQYEAREVTAALAEAAAAVAGTKRDDANLRLKAKRRFCRVAAEGLIHGTLASPYWQIWVAIWGSVASTPELVDDRHVGAIIEAGYEHATTQLAAGCSSVLESLGYNLRPGMSGYQLAVALGSLTEGFALRLRYDSDDVRELSAALDGQTEDWAIPGLCFEAIVDRFYEAPE